MSEQQSSSFVNVVLVLLVLVCGLLAFRDRQLQAELDWLYEASDPRGPHTTGGRSAAQQARADVSRRREPPVAPLHVEQPPPSGVTLPPAFAEALRATGHAVTDEPPPIVPPDILEQTDNGDVLPGAYIAPDADARPVITAPASHPLIRDVLRAHTDTELDEIARQQ